MNKKNIMLVCILSFILIVFLINEKNKEDFNINNPVIKYTLLI